MEATRHTPVLLQEAVEMLNLKPGDVAVDATLGGGGHMREILKRILPGGKVVAIDTDIDTLNRLRESAKTEAPLSSALADKTLVLVHGNYSLLEEVLRREGVEQCSAILADLGFSSDQIEAGERGFSFLKEGPLDMRLDRSTSLTTGRSTGLTAEEIVNTYSPGEISRILREYGDEPRAWNIAQAIVREREKHPIRTTLDLAALIEKAYPKRRHRIHPATKTFQALRIAVNREFEHLATFLTAATEHLKPGGRLAMIIFHSGEDTLVKRFFQGQAKGCVCPSTFPVCRCGKQPTLSILTKKPIIPSEEEQRENPRSRSAKLRVAEKR